MESSDYPKWARTLHFEAALTRALWKGHKASVLCRHAISKQPSQGHYGKALRRHEKAALGFRSSPHKGIMESILRGVEILCRYFEAALTRALWKGVKRSTATADLISKQPSQGHYGKDPSRLPPHARGFRSSPHKGIMESSCVRSFGSCRYFEAALTRALWKAVRLGAMSAGYFEAALTRALWKDQPSCLLCRQSFRSSPHKGIMESGRACRVQRHCHFEAALTRALWKDRGRIEMTVSRFRSSPHKGIMERGGCLCQLPDAISKQPSQGHYGKLPALLENTEI